MYKTIEFRWSELHDGKFVTTKWRRLAPSNFAEWFKRKPKSVTVINVRVLICSEISTANAIWEKWSWFRFGDMPHMDEIFKDLIKKLPCWYKETKNGVWANRECCTKAVNKEYEDALKKAYPTDAATE